jgi:tetratricopeptide (TPR) repeat protein
LKNNETEITEFVLKGVDTTKFQGDDAYKVGYSYGQKLFGDIQEKVVNECDSYFDYISKISSVMLDNMSKGNGQKDIDSLTRLIDKSPRNKALIWERGAYKIGVRDFKSAQSDFRLSIAQDSTFAPANFFLAWSYQLDGKSKKAIEEYQKTLSRSINLGSMEDIAKMYLAYLKRKLRESN